MRYSLIALTLWLSVGVIGQRPVEAIPVDEFGKLYCGDLLARIDHLFVQLENNPNSTAFIVINPQKGAPQKAEYNKTFIENIFQRRRFDLNRIRIVRGEETETDGGKFYLLLPGAADPMKNAIAWPEKKLDLEKPFVFGVEADEDPCPDFPLPTYAELIRSNPNRRGHVVFFPNPLRNRNELMKEWKKALTVGHKIPGKQLRFFFGPARDWSYIEFWLVPAKKK